MRKIILIAICLSFFCHVNLGWAETDVQKITDLAKSGDVKAQFRLGVMYDYGKDVPKNYTEAAKWFRKAADQGYAQAQNQLGDMYKNGRGVPQDYTEAVQWFRKAANQGHIIAQYNLGIMYHYGKGVSQNYAEAIKWYRKVADKGYSKAEVQLGLMYAIGKGVPQNFAEAMKWLRKAADKKNVMAQWVLGQMYYNGDGVPKNFVKAYVWFSLASNRGYEKAKKDLDKLLPQMTLEQIAQAQFNLGEMYYFGQSAVKNKAEAIKLFKKAADQGSADAQQRLGFMYYTGQDVPKDFVKAYVWFSFALANGYELAKKNLDILRPQMTPEQIAQAQKDLDDRHELGQSVSKSETKAMRLYREAVDQGIVSSQYMLGHMYYNGEDVPKDFVKAYAWWGLAFANGYGVAKMNLEKLRTQMTSEQVAQAKRETAELWKQVNKSNK